MALDFKSIINQKINGGNQDLSDRHEQDRIKVGRKNPFFGRIVPLGEDEFFAKDFEEAWVDYVTKEGKQSVVKVVIDSKTGNDELGTLLNDIFWYNYNYRKNHQDFTGDKIVINHKNTKYNFNINRQYEFVAIPMIKAGNSWQLAQAQNGGYAFKNYAVSYSVFNRILEMTQDSTLFIEGKPFDTDLGFITPGKTLPVKIALNSSNRYDVSVANLTLPEITYDYLAKDNNGDFLYFDDPNKFNKLTKDTNPTMYRTLLAQLQQSFEEQKKS